MTTTHCWDAASYLAPDIPWIKDDILTLNTDRCVIYVAEILAEADADGIWLDLDDLCVALADIVEDMLDEEDWTPSRASQLADIRLGFLTMQ